MITRATMAAVLVEVARAELGHREDGTSNRGSQINKYFGAVGMEPGDAWCAAFVGWDVREGGRRLGMELDWCYSGYCPDLANWARQRGCAAKGRAAPGMVMLQWHASLGRYAHTGIVEAVTGGSVTCIEGNTNADGGRSGVAVMRHTRDLSDRYLYVDLLAVNQTPTAAVIRVGDRELPGWMRADRLYTPARPLAERVGARVGFVAGKVTVNDKPLETVTLLGTGHVPARDLVEAAGRRCEWRREALTLVVG